MLNWRLGLGDLDGCRGDWPLDARGVELLVGQALTALWGLGPRLEALGVGREDERGSGGDRGPWLEDMLQTRRA